MPRTSGYRVSPCLQRLRRGHPGGIGAWLVGFAEAQEVHVRRCEREPGDLDDSGTWNEVEVHRVDMVLRRIYQWRDSRAGWRGRATSREIARVFGIFGSAPRRTRGGRRTATRPWRCRAAWTRVIATGPIVTGLTASGSKSWRQSLVCHRHTGWDIDLSPELSCSPDYGWFGGVGWLRSAPVPVLRIQSLTSRSWAKLRQAAAGDVGGEVG